MGRLRVVRPYLYAVGPLNDVELMARQLASKAIRKSITEDEKLDYLIKTIESLQRLGYSSGDITSVVHMSYEQEEPLHK